MKVPRPARPMTARIVRYKSDPPPGPSARVQPCPGCQLLALSRDPEEGFTVCAGCGMVISDEDYLDRFGPDPEVFGPIGPASHPPVVYYMRLDAIVKIGFTTRLGRRLMDINPQGVLAVEWGARRMEMQRHNDFAAQHIHGEWFRFGPELAAHVVDVRSAFETDMGCSTEAWLADVSAHEWWEPAPVPAVGVAKPE
jgi:hypothetical protein